FIRVVVLVVSSGWHLKLQFLKVPESAKKSHFTCCFIDTIRRMFSFSYRKDGVLFLVS
ncbi:unnamed protein product, partial [Musa acuminata var. zebrina]